MSKIERNLPQEQRKYFIDQVFSPDFEDGLFFFLFNPVAIPANQNIYEQIATGVAGIFLERGFIIHLTYTLIDTRFTLEIKAHNEDRAKELTDALVFYIDKALQGATGE